MKRSNIKVGGKLTRTNNGISIEILSVAGNEVTYRILTSGTGKRKRKVGRIRIGTIDSIAGNYRSDTDQPQITYKPQVGDVLRATRSESRIKIINIDQSNQMVEIVNVWSIDPNKFNVFAGSNRWIKLTSLKKSYTNKV